MQEIDNWLGQFREILGKRFEQLDEVLINLKKQEP